MRALFLAAVAAVLLSVTVVKATPVNDFRTSRAQVILNDAVDTGAPLFNDGDHQDCYLVYRGALRSTLPLLSDRQDVKDRIEAALWRAEHNSSKTQRAWILRHAIDQALADLN